MRAVTLAVLGSAFALGGAFGCGSGNGVGPGTGGTDGGGAMDAAPVDDVPSNVGTVSAKLEVAPGVAITTLSFTISNPTLLPADRTGSVDISDSQNIQFVVGGLPAGAGYTVAVSGIAEPGNFACTGSASFAVQTNGTTTVNIIAVCTVAGDAGGTGSVSVGCATVIAPLCAAVTSLSASPSDVDVGGVIKLTANGIDAQGDSSDVTLSWSLTGGAGSGTFSSATGASSDFTCTQAGPVTVTVAAATSPMAMCQGNTASIVLSCDGKKVTAIAASPHDHVCALVADGTVDCWGSNEAGQLGNGKTDSSLVPVRVQNLSNVTAIVAGNTHTCALLATGTVECWGEQSMLGTGTAGGLDDCGLPCSMSPVPVVGLSAVTAIAAGSTHTCALVSGGTVECWGDNLSGELGDGTMNNQLAPVRVQGIAGATAISAGDSDTCALLSGGTVQCWGYNYSGQLGNGTTGPDNCSGYPCSLKPVAVVGLSNVTSIVSGGSHTCAVLSDRTAECWGFNDVGELGNGSLTSSAKPVPVSNVSDVVSLAAGVYHSCALLSGGTVACWGDDSRGEFCNGLTTNSGTPTTVANLGGATAVSLGEYDTCALLPGGSVACCGLNTQGQLGNGTVNNSSTPVPVGL
jgi:alpha-tubulin suppressor-like RCC1 family protein